ncbi:glycoside hydrolase family 30 protein [Pseudochryseolinea flava]|uniref:Glucosylceramidase n=1 Tax=Pseudochryseolinea flava TaxID=2059302 RepID=A0A364Y5Z4_9BACT|nr:glycoside hydrolase family 30 beta sandwich domain-containing protein [Pseudochryseolinea flava]RAW02408.1 glucosylceramidase [Pseudochryseolinea flava]
MRKKALTCLTVVTICFSLSNCTNKSPDESGVVTDGDVEYWLTTGDKKSLLSKRELNFNADAVSKDIIDVDTTKIYQDIDGFGYALTGGSAMLLHTKLDQAKRTALLQELFTTEGNNIGINYLRVSIGASDLDDHVFSYDDVKGDKDLKHFTLDEDRKHLIPVLKEILALNPKIKIMGSPWSAPAWMKDNQHAKGGSLKPEFYETYAQYFVKYIQQMQQEGITIDAITLQNEPENPNNTPSMIMTAQDQAAFVKNNLGPAFQQAGIKTKIVVFDHNCDHPEYPITVLNDSSAKKFIDGSAFHLYLGEISALSKVRDAHPDKNIYFTEQWTSGKGEFGGDLVWHTRELIIGSTRNWSRNVLEWNLAADPQFNPHTGDGGCTLCQGALTIGDSVTRNVSYYIIAHASKFVPDGSKRISSTLINGVQNVAFITPAGKKVLVAVNDSNSDKAFDVQYHGKKFNVTLPASAVGTFVW